MPFSTETKSPYILLLNPPLHSLSTPPLFFLLTTTPADKLTTSLSGTIFFHKKSVDKYSYAFFHIIPSPLHTFLYTLTHHHSHPFYYHFVTKFPSFHTSIHPIYYHFVTTHPSFHTTIHPTLLSFCNHTPTIQHLHPTICLQNSTPRPCIN